MRTNKKMEKNKKSESVSRKILRLIMTLLIIGLTVVMIIPFIWMISASFKTQADVMRIPIEWIPKYFYIDNFKTM